MLASAPAELAGKILVVSEADTVARIARVTGRVKYFLDRAGRLTLASAGGRERALPAAPLTAGSDFSGEGAWSSASSG